MKICCIADLHIGLKTYAELDGVNGLYDREIEVLDNFKKVVDICLSQSISILIIAGDVYHNFNPSANLQNEVNRILYYASQNKLYVLILEGNHDLKKNNYAVSSLEVFNTFHVPYIIHTSRFLDKEIVINNERTRFLFLPTYTNNQEIQYLLEQNIFDYDGNVIVIGHFTTQGAQLNDWLIAENEEYIDLNLFNDKNIDFVVLGHLHKHQILNSNPLIFYTGALQRVDFNEEDQEKGYVIIDTNTKELKFYPLKTQLFYTIRIDLKEKSSLDYIKSLIDINKIENAIIRIIINTSEELKLSVEEEQILKNYILEYQPKKVLTIQQNIKDNKKIRNEAFNESLTIDKALEIYYKDQLRGKERIDLGKQIINQYLF